MRLLFPSRVEHGFREKICSGLQRCFDEKRKEFMVHGASNTNKTGTFSDLTLTMWFARPEFTSVYICSPYESATETNFWARIIEQFNEAKDNNPDLPGRFKQSENAIVLDERNPLSFIRVITTDQLGKLVGKKSKHFLSGYLFIMCDELPEFRGQGQALVKAMDNIRSVPNSLLVGAGNFSSPNDALGVFSEPEGEKGYAGLDIERDHEWVTSRGGLCVRLDGERSPNVLAGRDYLPFVTTIEYLNGLALTSGGRKSAGYLRFGRSFPCLDVDEKTFTNRVKMQSGGCFDEFKWTSRELEVVGFCDPGWGGDPCVIQFLRVGWMETGGAPLQIVELFGAPITVVVEKGKIDEVTGRELTEEMQIVQACRRECEEHDCPDKCFGFDGSMRSGIVQAFLVGWSPNVNPIDSLGAATDRKVAANRKNRDGEFIVWKEIVANFATELWMAVASLIDSSQLRGMGTSPDAARQLCTRRWEWAGKKKQIEPKYTSAVKWRENGALKGGYLAREGRKSSPNEADALAGAVEMARRNGLVLNGISGKDSNSVKLIAELMKTFTPKPDPGSLRSRVALSGSASLKFRR